MKLLKLSYVLLSLSVTDLGFLLFRLTSDTPPGFLFDPLLVVAGLFLLLAGSIAGIVQLVLLIWSVIAYEPQAVPIRSEKIKANFMLLFAFAALNGTAHYALRPKPAIYKSQILFKDPVIAVQDSMNVLRQLGESVEAKDFLSCYVRWQDSTLFFSVPVTRHLESVTENLGRIDTITSFNKGFRYMKQAEVIRLLAVIKFLNRNLIAGIVHDTSIGYWHYPYGMDNYDTGHQWIRHLYLRGNSGDTLKPSFNYYFNVIDKKEKVVLTAMNDVQYRRFD